MVALFASCSFAHGPGGLNIAYILGSVATLLAMAAYILRTKKPVVSKVTLFLAGVIATAIVIGIATDNHSRTPHGHSSSDSHTIPEAAKN